MKIRLTTLVLIALIAPAAGHLSARTALATPRHAAAASSDKSAAPAKSATSTTEAHATSAPAAAAPATPVKTFIDTSELRVAPPFKLPNLAGKPVELSAYRGKLVLLAFWSTTCPACRNESALFIDLQKRYGPSGLQVVAISVDEQSQADVDLFVRTRHLNYDVLRGDDDVMAIYGGVGDLPCTFLVTQDGKIFTRYVGVRPPGTIEDDVKKLLGIKS